MASQERLEYFISAAFKDEGVRQAMQAFGKLNAESAKVVNEMNRMASSSARVGQNIRESRTPFAQLGMQVNQFGTQLAGGTSVATAFAQQIGDVGWALMNAQGALGSVGRFLAGPWGAALAIGAAVLGPLVSGLFSAADGTKKLVKAQKEGAAALDEYSSALKTLEGLQEDYAIMIAKTIQAEINLRKQHVASAKDALVAAQAKVTASQAVVQAAFREYIMARKLADDRVDVALMLGDAEAAGILQMTTSGDATRKKALADIAATAAISDLADMTKAQGELQRRINALTGAEIQQQNEASAADKKRESALDSLIQKRNSLIDSIQGTINTSTSETSAIGRAKNQLDAFNDTLSALGKSPGGGEFIGQNSEKITLTGLALEEAASGLTEWRRLIGENNKKELPEFEVRLNAINKAFGDMNEGVREGVRVQEEFTQQITGVAISELDKLQKKAEELGNKSIDPVTALRRELNALAGSLSGDLFKDMDVEAVTAKINAVGDAINNLELSKTNEIIKKSFDDIGMSVSNAFKGMITGASSFGDAMGSIINAVIDKLWEMYVVQQIVGMVTGVLGKLGLPVPVPQNANGTPSFKGGMTWVGERGPELVNLPRGTGIIPAHRASQMTSGGGVTVNVDARGSADPAAVRAQVQQGILEAAPAIVAAAQQRTVAGLRRPRLGGVMQ